MNKGYCGWLSSSDIAEGMNAAKRNAVRLAKDARLLFENERYATALAIAVLSIEEVGKSYILRGLAVASSQEDLRARWREYRSHKDKNALWQLMEMLQKGARRLQDFASMFAPRGENSEMLDSLKQLCLYTDSFNKGAWTDPNTLATRELSEAILKIAEIFSSMNHQVTTEEIDLWIQYLKPVWDFPDERERALIEWDREMRRRGLIKQTTDMNMETFIKIGFEPKAGRKQPLDGKN